MRDALQAAQPSARLFAFVVHSEPRKRPPDLRVALTPRELETKRQALLVHQADVSPVHDYLAKQFAIPEEIFWEFRRRQSAGFADAAVLPGRPEPGTCSLEISHSGQCILPIGSS